VCDHIPSIPMRMDEPIPEADFRAIPILWGKRGLRVKLQVTSPCLVSCMTHYIGARTRPCYAPVTHCRGCAAGYGRIWKGFLGGVCCYSRVNAIVMFGLGAARPWAERWRKDPGWARGQVLTLEHEGGRSEGSVRLTFAPPVLSGALPEPIDVEGALKATWARWAALTPPDAEERWEMIPLPGE